MEGAASDSDVCMFVEPEPLSFERQRRAGGGGFGRLTDAAAASKSEGRRPTSRDSSAICSFAPSKLSRYNSSFYIRTEGNLHLSDRLRSAFGSLDTGRSSTEAQDACSYSEGKWTVYTLNGVSGEDDAAATKQGAMDYIGSLRRRKENVKRQDDNCMEMDDASEDDVGDGGGSMTFSSPSGAESSSATTVAAAGGGSVFLMPECVVGGTKRPNVSVQRQWARTVASPSERKRRRDSYASCLSFDDDDNDDSQWC